MELTQLDRLTEGRSGRPDEFQLREGVWGAVEGRLLRGVLQRHVVQRGFHVPEEDVARLLQGEEESRPAHLL